MCSLPLSFANLYLEALNHGCQVVGCERKQIRPALMLTIMIRNGNSARHFHFIYAYLDLKERYTRCFLHMHPILFLAETHRFVRPTRELGKRLSEH